MSRVGHMALLAQKLGLESIAHRLLDNAILRKPLHGIIDELQDALKTVDAKHEQFVRAVDLQVLIDEFRSAKEAQK